MHHRLSFLVDYPDRQLNRWSTAFRLLAIIPIGIVLGVITGSSIGDFNSHHGGAVIIGGTGVLFLPALLMILFRQKYPRWWFDWNLNFLRFTSRVAAYMALMTDAYPSTDDEQSVHLKIDYPDAKTDLKRWLPLVKWFLAIPHFVVLAFLGIGAMFAVVAAWFAILFTGRYPTGLFHFVEGVMRWNLRVIGYAFILATDEYPPFTLSVV